MIPTDLDILAAGRPAPVRPARYSHAAVAAWLRDMRIWWLDAAAGHAAAAERLIAEGMSECAGPELAGARGALGEAARLAPRAASAITAQVIDINDERIHDGGMVSVDTIEIRRDGRLVAQVEVSSAQERAPYDRAVRRVIGAAEFTWLPEAAS